ncbi:MAG: hypothetical protein J7647_26180 [Cyanobacteria bacterium SBLK]|nr:hypothetical protein [Cyanobacteria bacterium SBLK]
MNCSVFELIERDNPDLIDEAIALHNRKVEAEKKAYEKLRKRKRSR